MQNERLERLRSELADLRERENHLAYYGAHASRGAAELSEQERGELASLRARIPLLEGTIAEAENLSLTGDGATRP